LTDGPGPGAYTADVSKIKEKPPGVAFGSPSKNKGITDPTPGPGNYDTPGYINPGGKAGGYSFGKDAPHQKVSDTPGPGHYYIPVKVADTPEYALPGGPKEFRRV
jgi:hypothetical protein